jgi:formyltetrahydrofolate deformylase
MEAVTRPMLRFGKTEDFRGPAEYARIESKGSGSWRVMKDIGRLLISCQDRPGIVATVSQFLFQRGANILQSNQYSVESGQGAFFMRIEFEEPELEQRIVKFRHDFQNMAHPQGFHWQLGLSSRRKQMAIFVSKETHCLRELLWLWQSGELDVDIKMVISNYEEARSEVESLGISFYYIPVTSETKEEAESRQLKLLHQGIDLIALARYMQILSPSFLSQYNGNIINIHHSFLPAFIGKNPYHRAYQRGVKLIGATAHYVTSELDEGPIIEQDVYRVNHQQDAQELKRIGRQVERAVLARAIRWHIEDRVIVHENKTIVFA